MSSRGALSFILTNERGTKLCYLPLKEQSKHLTYSKGKIILRIDSPVETLFSTEIIRLK